MRIVSALSNSVKFLIGSKRFLLLAVIAMSVTALAFVVPRFASPISSAHGGASAKTKQQGCCSNQSAILRRMVGTYYTTEDNFKSTL